MYLLDTHTLTGERERELAAGILFGVSAFNDLESLFEVFLGCLLHVAPNDYCCPPMAVNTLSPRLHLSEMVKCDPA